MKTNIAFVAQIGISHRLVSQKYVLTCACSWMRRLCCPVRLPSWVSTRLWTPWSRPRVSWTPTLSVTNTTTAPPPSRRSSRITRVSRISSPFWVWENCPRRRSSPSTERERSNDSSLNHSRYATLSKRFASQMTHSAPHVLQSRVRTFRCDTNQNAALFKSIQSESHISKNAAI